MNYCHRRGSYHITRYYWTSVAARFAGLGIAAALVLILGLLGVVVVRGF